jgi:hypothetical protein
MHQVASQCRMSDSAGLAGAESAPGCNISAQGCGCGKALEALRGTVARALVLLHGEDVGGAARVLRSALGSDEVE